MLAGVAPFAVGLFVWRRWYRLGSAATPSPFTPLGGMGLFVFMFLLGVAGAGIARSFAETPADAEAPVTTPAGAIMLIGMIAGQSAVLVAYLWLCRRSTARSPVGAARAALVGAGGFLLAWPVVSGTNLIAGLVDQALTGEPVEALAHETLKRLAAGPPDTWAFVTAGLVVLAVPVLEEVLYRGILQRMLGDLELGPWPAILAASLVFVLMHWGAVPIHAMPGLYVLSVGFGWAYERTGRLAAPIAMHAIFNLTNVALAVLWTSAGSGGPG